MWKLAIKFGFSIALLVLGASAASGDTMDLARFSIAQAEAGNEYLFYGQVSGQKTSEGEIIWPADCAPLKGSRQIYSGVLNLDYRLRCSRPLSGQDQITLPWGQDGGVLTSNLAGKAETRMLQRSAGGLVLPLGMGEAESRPLGLIAAQYTSIGIHHILIGWDHLAFIACLCLLAGGSTLLWLVTAFTVGHSLSLALSYFGIVSVAVPPVEVVIALSIAFMAREAFMAWRQGRDAGAARWRYVAIVAAFGVLHGLGFASVLGEIGVSPAERVTGLVFFNIGVEIGQLLFIAALTAIGFLVGRLGMQRPLRLASVFLVGAVGCFWTIERMAGILATA